MNKDISSQTSGKQSNAMKLENGYTLIEMIIALVLLGILSITIFAKFNDMQQTIETIVCKTNQLSLQTAQTLYYISTNSLIDEGHYAETLDELLPFLMHSDDLQCPGKGHYILFPNGEVTCSLKSHQ